MKNSFTVWISDIASCAEVGVIINFGPNELKRCIISAHVPCVSFIQGGKEEESDAIILKRGKILHISSV